MKNKKTLLIIILAIVLNFGSSNISFANEDTTPKTVYPDYACEFAGKDTCEKFNRKLFVFNLKLNKYIIRPINIVWSSVMPQYAMDRVKNAYNNINFPVRLVGCLLQKDFQASKEETISFLTNTTMGIGGLYNPAQTKFKIETHDENMGQVLAHYNVKKGPYLVLPIVRGNVSDLVGQLLDCPLKPTNYVGPFGSAASAIFAVNNSTYTQPIVKRIDDSYADPYEIAKQIDGIQRYIKNENLDRSEVFAEKTATQNIIQINQFSEEANLSPHIKPDIELINYNPQGSLVDSMRTALFDNQKIDSSPWAELSVWNKTFSKKIKFASVNIDQGRADYKFRYILQKDKTAPLAILYPSIGEGILADKSTVLAKMLYDEGYSVAIQGSAFQWEFIKSMPEGYKPGIPSADAEKLRLVTSKIIESLESKNGAKFEKKTLVGCSFGAMTGLFVAAQEEQEALLGKNSLGISNYIAINPPIDVFFAMKQLDKYSKEWKNDPSDIKMRTAITAEKAVHYASNIYHKDIDKMPESTPFTDAEAKQIVGFIMKQKLYDVVFAIENCSRGKQSNLYESINNMSFEDYSQKYLAEVKDPENESSTSATSLYSISDFLRKNKNFKIYHTLDDYFVNKEQLAWLKKQTKNKSVYFNNGSHLGFMYRKEFVEQFKKDIKPESAVVEVNEGV